MTDQVYQLKFLENLKDQTETILFIGTWGLCEQFANDNGWNWKNDTKLPTNGYWTRNKKILMPIEKTYEHPN